jgi:hypothetical protein
MGRRRGLLARFAFLVPEVERPYEYSDKTKWTITGIVALAGSASPLGSAIFYREYPRCSPHAHVGLCTRVQENLREKSTDDESAPLQPLFPRWRST